MWLVAAEADAGNSQLIIAIFVFLGVVVTALGGVVVALINSRADRTAPSPPAPAAAPTPSGAEHVKLYERVAVLERRADDSDNRDEVQDRRLDQLEDIVDTDNPRWIHLRERRNNERPPPARD